MKIVHGSLIASLMILLAVPLHATKPLSRWHKAGKSAHPQATAKKGKARDAYCTNACKKAGARKATDLGACKESCVFG